MVVVVIVFRLPLGDLLGGEFRAVFGVFVTVGRIEGFLVSDHYELAGEYAARAAGWLADGTLTLRETSVDGIEHAVDAFLGVLRGENTGKMVVRL